MNAAIIIVSLMFIAATSAAPLSMRCMELLNSTGPYDYCNIIKNISQGGDSVKDLIFSANNVTKTFRQICKKEENTQVSMHM